MFWLRLNMKIPGNGNVFAVAVLNHIVSVSTNESVSSPLLHLPEGFVGCRFSNPGKIVVRYKGWVKKQKLDTA